MYRRFDPQTARAMVDLLRSRAVQLIGVRLGNVQIEPADFETLASLAERGRILVIYDPTLGTRSAYNYAGNFWGNGRRGLGTAGQQGLVVHEAVHATNDWHRRVVNGRDDEALAYVAQLLHYRLSSPAAFTPVAEARLRQRTPIAVAACGAGNGQLCDPAMAGSAAIIAGELVEGRVPTAAMWNQLRLTISRHPDYRRMAEIAGNSGRVYNGI